MNSFLLDDNLVYIDFIIIIGSENCVYSSIRTILYAISSTTFSTEIQGKLLEHDAVQV